MQKPFVTEAMLAEYRKDKQIAKLQSEVLGQAHDRETKRKAEAEAKRKHCEELRTWAMVANGELHKQHIYGLRREWVGKIRDAGLSTDDAELWELAKVKYPMK